MYLLDFNLNSYFHTNFISETRIKKYVIDNLLYTQIIFKII